MRTPRARCGNCGRSFPEDETALVQGSAAGNYRRANRRTQRRVCRSCTQQRVDYARTGQSSGGNTPLNSSHINWEQAARAFGIEITGLRTSQMTDRRAS